MSVLQEEERKEYDLKHPLYPHPDLLDWVQNHGIEYIPYNQVLKRRQKGESIEYKPLQGNYDTKYQKWYSKVRADHDEFNVSKRPIYREVSQIIRRKTNNKDYIEYSETLIGLDRKQVEKPFFHTYGSYKRMKYTSSPDYDDDDQIKASSPQGGTSETIYFIEYSPEKIQELYDDGIQDKDIELIVMAGDKPYGGRGFFTRDEFKNLSLEKLAEKGATGKNRFAKIDTKLPISEFMEQKKIIDKANTTETTIDPQEYQLLQEFKKWKLSQNQKPAAETEGKSNKKTTRDIKAVQ